jgi:hypothetical protein
MKKLIIVIWLILSHSIISSGKVPIEFSVEPDISYGFWATETVSCGVDLDHKQSRFQVDITASLSDDMIVTSAVFLGTFTRSGQYLYFEDIQTGVTMTAKVSANSITFTKSPAFLKDREWVAMTGDLAGRRMSYEIDSDATSAKEKRTELYSPSFVPATALFGTYRGDIVPVLELTDDHKYQLLFDNFVAFKGTWSRDGNILRLTDPDAKATYYGVIQGERIRSLCFPCYTFGENSYYEKGPDLLPYNFDGRVRS